MCSSDPTLDVGDSTGETVSNGNSGGDPLRGPPVAQDAVALV